MNELQRVMCMAGIMTLQTLIVGLIIIMPWALAPFLIIWWLLSALFWWLYYKEIQEED